jgi:hypothetical protein
MGSTFRGHRNNVPPIRGRGTPPRSDSCHRSQIDNGSKVARLIPRRYVPFYRQSFDFTCGPACLIMAMRRYRPDLVVSRELELDIWREANLVEADATSRQGLALAAHRRGFRVRTQGNVESVELLDCLGLKLSPESRAVAKVLHRDLKRRCRQSRIRDDAGAVQPSDLVRWLERGWTPIVLVDSRLVISEALPHWVVVTRMEPSAATIQDPLARKGNTVVGLDDLTRCLGFQGTQCAVVLEGRRRGRRGIDGTIRGTPQTAA